MSSVHSADALTAYWGPVFHIWAMNSFSWIVWIIKAYCSQLQICNLNDTLCNNIYQSICKLVSSKCSSDHVQFLNLFFYCSLCMTSDPNRPALSGPDWLVSEDDHPQGGCKAWIAVCRWWPPLAPHRPVKKSGTADEWEVPPQTQSHLWTRSHNYRQTKGMIKKKLNPRNYNLRMNRLFSCPTTTVIILCSQEITQNTYVTL